MVHIVEVANLNQGVGAVGKSENNGGATRGINIDISRRRVLCKMIRVIKIKEERSKEKVPAECCQRSSERVENKAMRRESLVHGLRKGSHDVRHVMPTAAVLHLLRHPILDRKSVV